MTPICLQILKPCKFQAKLINDVRSQGDSYFGGIQFSEERGIWLLGASNNTLFLELGAGYIVEALTFKNS